MILRIDNMFFSAMKNFNVSRKISSACFSVIFDANNRDKLKKKRQIERIARKTSKFIETNLKKNRANRTKREKDVNVLKAFINNFLSDAVISLKLNNEVVLILKFKT